MQEGCDHAKRGAVSRFSVTSCNDLRSLSKCDRFRHRASPSRECSLVSTHTTAGGSDHLRYGIPLRKRRVLINVLLVLDMATTDIVW